MFDITESRLQWRPPLSESEEFEAGTVLSINVDCGKV